MRACRLELGGRCSAYWTSLGSHEYLNLKGFVENCVAEKDD
jgi:hypothetical protein